MASSDLFSSGGRKRTVGSIDDLDDIAFKRFKLSDSRISSPTDTSDSESEGSVLSGKRTPSTPQSSKDWPSLKKTIKCPYSECDKSFNRQAKLRDHLCYHTGERPFTCPHEGCSRSFPRKTHLDRHIKSAHTNVRDYNCTYEGCGKAFSTGTRLRRHEAAHEKRSQFKCEECGREFRKHTTLQKHETTEHLGLKPFICGTILEDGTSCGAGFDRATGLKQHQSHVHGHPNYTCTLCKDSSNNKEESSCPSDYEFSTYSELQSHNRLEHPPSCSICGTTWQTVKQVNRHLELEHGIIVENSDGEAKPTPFVCTEVGCDRAFSKNGNLKVHIQAVHAQARPFICGSSDTSILNNVKGWDGQGACLRSFKAKSQLEEHIRTVHLGMDHRHKARRRTKKAIDAESALRSNQPTAKSKVIGALTGAAYGNSQTCSIPCVVTGCTFTTDQNYDLEVHLRSRHGMDENEIQLIRMSRQTHLLEDESYNNNENIDSSDFISGELELAADNGGSFWVGGRAEDADSDHARDWEAEQTEMQYLIGDGQGWEDDIIIDPTLS